MTKENKKVIINFSKKNDSLSNNAIKNRIISNLKKAEKLLDNNKFKNLQKDLILNLKENNSINVVIDNDNYKLENNMSGGFFNLFFSNKDSEQKKEEKEEKVEDEEEEEKEEKVEDEEEKEEEGEEEKKENKEDEEEDEEEKDEDEDDEEEENKEEKKENKEDEEEDEEEEDEKEDEEEKDEDEDEEEEENINNKKSDYINDNIKSQYGGDKYLLNNDNLSFEDFLDEQTFLFDSYNLDDEEESLIDNATKLKNNKYLNNLNIHELREIMKNNNLKVTNKGNYLKKTDMIKKIKKI